jgi:iron complex outermembrane recepter protein
MKQVLFVLAWILVSMPVPGQHTLSGTVLDEKNDPLAGASVIISELNRGTVTGKEGEFIFSGIPAGRYTLNVTFLGYVQWISEVDLKRNLVLEEIAMEQVAFMGEEVMVTAIRAGSTTPVAYTGITEEEIRSRNFGQDIPYILTTTPSMVTSSDAGHGIGYTSMRIRGTDANRINVTINGIPLNDAESHSVFWVDLPDIATSVDHIQVQRGVGTSTNGAAAFGASVNVQTQDLEKIPYAVYDGSFGSFNTMRHSISAGTGLIGEHFSMDLRLSDIRSDGFIDRAWTDLNSYYLSAGFHDARTLVKFITFSGTEELYQAWNGVPSSHLAISRTYNELGAFTGADGNLQYYDNQIDHYRQDHYQLHLSRKLSDALHISGALHYTRGAGYYEEYREDQSLSDYKLEEVIAGGDTIAESDLVRRKWLDNHFYGAIASLQYRSDRVTTILGGGWNRYDGDHFGTVIWARFPGTSEIRHRWYENTGIKSDWNTYLKTTLETGSGISFFADIQVRGIGYGIEGIDDDFRDITQDHNYLFFNPKAGMNWQLGPSQRTYLFLARANREPNRSNFTDADPAGPVPVKETMNDYEAGYAFMSEHFSLNANLYFMDYTDQLVLTGEINDVGAPVMTNVKDSYRAGVEIAAGASITRWLRWDLNSTFSRNRIPDYHGKVDNWDFWEDPESEPYQVAETLGNTDLAFSPSIIMNSLIDVEPLRNLHLNLVTRYVGKQFIDNTSSEDRILDPYLVNDLRISYTIYPQFIKEIGLQLMVANLLDTEYETNAWIYRYYTAGTEQYMDGYFPQAGIHLMAGIRLNF